MLFFPQYLSLSAQFVEPRKFRSFMGGQQGMEATARISIQNGARVGITVIHDHYRTPLFWAAFRGCEAVVNMLLEDGPVDADFRDSNGWTPLIRAAQAGHEAVVKLLLDTGRVDADSKESMGWTPLSSAASRRHEAVVGLLQLHSARREAKLLESSRLISQGSVNEIDGFEA